MDKSIMPECYADTLLIETLVPTKVGYNHKTSCFKVESEMTLGKLRDRFAVGIIDNDRVQIKYLKQFELINAVGSSLLLWRHKEAQKHHFIIQICPALEQWLLDVCADELIDLGAFGLDNDLEGLKKYTKKTTSLYDPNLVRLFREIALKEDNVSVRKLKYWIRTLKEENYKVDINRLKNG